MSRSGFYEADDYDRDAILSMGRTRGRVASATRGRRGQSFLKAALSALDKMPDKRLAGGTFGVRNGCMCFMTSIATETGRASAFTGVDLSYGDEAVCEKLAGAFDVAPVLIQELVWDNDEYPYANESERWRGMRNRVAASITDSAGCE